MFRYLVDITQHWGERSSCSIDKSFLSSGRSMPTSRLISLALAEGFSFAITHRWDCFSASIS